MIRRRLPLIAVSATALTSALFAPAPLASAATSATGTATAAQIAPTTCVVGMIKYVTSPPETPVCPDQQTPPVGGHLTASPNQGLVNLPEEFTAWIDQNTTTTYLPKMGQPVDPSGNPVGAPVVTCPTWTPANTTSCPVTWKNPQITVYLDKTTTGYNAASDNCTTWTCWTVTSPVAGTLYQHSFQYRSSTQTVYHPTLNVSWTAVMPYILPGGPLQVQNPQSLPAAYTKYLSTTNWQQNTVTEIPHGYTNYTLTHSYGSVVHATNLTGNFPSSWNCWGLDSRVAPCTDYSSTTQVNHYATVCNNCGGTDSWGDDSRWSWLGTCNNSGGGWANEAGEADAGGGTWPRGGNYNNNCVPAGDTDDGYYGWTSPSYGSDRLSWHNSRVIGGATTQYRAYSTQTQYYDAQSYATNSGTYYTASIGWAPGTLTWIHVQPNTGYNYWGAIGTKWYPNCAAGQTANPHCPADYTNHQLTYETSPCNGSTPDTVIGGSIGCTPTYTTPTQQWHMYTPQLQQFPTAQTYTVADGHWDNVPQNDPWIINQGVSWIPQVAYVPQTTAFDWGPGPWATFWNDYTSFQDHYLEDQNPPLHPYWDSCYPAWFGPDKDGGDGDAGWSGWYNTGCDQWAWTTASNPSYFWSYHVVTPATQYSPGNESLPYNVGLPNDCAPLNTPACVDNPGSDYYQPWQDLATTTSCGTLGGGSAVTPAADSAFNALPYSQGQATDCYSTPKVTAPDPYCPGNAGCQTSNTTGYNEIYQLTITIGQEQPVQG